VHTIELHTSKFWSFQSSIHAKFIWRFQMSSIRGLKAEQSSCGQADSRTRRDHIQISTIGQLPSALRQLTLWLHPTLTSKVLICMISGWLQSIRSQYNDHVAAQKSVVLYTGAACLFVVASQIVPLTGSPPFRRPHDDRLTPSRYLDVLS
jgi:hypothetical protein